MGAFVHPLARVHRPPHHPAPLRTTHLRGGTFDTQQPGDGGCPPAICNPGNSKSAVQIIESLINSLVNFFTGVPRSLKSLEVVQRLFKLLRQEQGSRFFQPVSRMLWEMLKLIEGGDVLSESGGGLRRFYNITERAAQKLALETGLPVRELDRILNEAVFGDHDGPLRAVLRRGLQPAPEPPPLPSGGGGGGAQLGSPGGGGGQPQIASDDCARRCASIALEAPELYIPCLAACSTPFAPPNLARLGRQLGENIGRELTQRFLRQPDQPTLPPGSQPRSFQPQQHPLELEPQQPPAPLLDTITPCPSCDRIGRQRAELEQEIETEQQQLTDQQIAQRQQQLDQLRQLERQPAEQRDIPRELELKRQLMQQLDQQEQQLLNPQAAQPEMQPLEPQPGELAPKLEGPQPVQVRPIQPQPQPAQQPVEQAVTFCVGCKSHEDAIMFLNGEPSGCSVIPGSTKDVGVPNG